MQPWEWAERNVSLPRNATVVKWDSSQSIFLRQITEDFKNPAVNEITCMCSAQSAKTETLIALLLWAIAEDPGPILWVTTNQGEARKIARMRIMPAIDMCAPVITKVPDGRYDRTTTTIYFPGAPLVICGADSPANLQSTPYRYIFLDEVRSWKPGAVQMVSKRTRSFPHSYKKVVVSTPSVANDQMHRFYLAGSQNQWHCKCPDCKAEFALDWGDRKSAGGLKWDENDETVKDGKIVFDRLLETVRYKCPGCAKEWRDNPKDRKLLSNSGKWVSQNRKHAKNVRSYQWNALLPWWPSWTDQVKEYHEAMAAFRIGAFQPLKDHYNETRGQVWTDEFRFAKDLGTIDERVGDYDITAFQAMAAAIEPSPMRRVRFTVDGFEVSRIIMTNDVQGKGGRHFWSVIRAWGPTGRSRRLASAKLYTIVEINQMAREWGVSPDDIVIDAAHWATEVYGYVLQSECRWKAFRGDHREFFTEASPEGPVKSITNVSWVDPAQGTRDEGRFGNIPLYHFSKPSTCDLLDSYLYGIIPGWEIDKGADEVYRLQVMAYYRHISVDKNGNEKFEWRSKREEHLADCERMQIAAAKLTGLLD